MKKLISTSIILAFSLFLTGVCQGQFAPPNGSTVAVTGGYDLINPAHCEVYGMYNGSVWSEERIDFNNSFVISFDASFEILGGDGGDGICVVFKQDGATNVLGPGGIDIGYYHGADFENNSFAVEFDTWDNAIFNEKGEDVDPEYNHIAVNKNADHTDQIVEATPVLADESTIEDGVTRNFKIEWCSHRNILNIYVENELRVSKNYDLKTIFTDASDVTWGFTSGKFLACSNHRVTNISLNSRFISCNNNNDNHTGILTPSYKTDYGYLKQNTPNPFYSYTQIKYNITKVNINAEIIIFDPLGRTVRKFSNLKKGEGNIELNDLDLKAGLYYYHLIIDGERVDTKKMIFLN